MTSRRSSSSSSSEITEHTSSRDRSHLQSETSRHSTRNSRHSHSPSHQRSPSQTNTVTSIFEETSIRSTSPARTSPQVRTLSPTVSYVSTTAQSRATGSQSTPYDSTSIAPTATGTSSTGRQSSVSTSQQTYQQPPRTGQFAQNQISGAPPLIRPTNQGPGASVNVFGPNAPQMHQQAQFRPQEYGIRQQGQGLRPDTSGARLPPPNFQQQVQIRPGVSLPFGPNAGSQQSGYSASLQQQQQGYGPRPQGVPQGNFSPGVQRPPVPNFQRGPNVPLPQHGGFGQQNFQQLPQINVNVGPRQAGPQAPPSRPQISPYSGSTSSGGSAQSPGSASIQQQRPLGPVSPGLSSQTRPSIPQQYPQSIATSPRQQFPGAIPPHMVYNELLGPDAFKDVILNIDYGAVEAFNSAFQNGGEGNFPTFEGGMPPGINIRPAYTTVDSLNYQSHMFNTGRTIDAGSNHDNQYLGGGYGGGAESDYYSTNNDIYSRMAHSTGYESSIGGGQDFQSVSGYQTGETSYGGDIPINYQKQREGGAQGGFFEFGSGAEPGANVANILNQSGLERVLHSAGR
ncbi:unnamed protein product [Didymodactylos carnosus]|uniref:Uncharacterized protein n=1 Tax=Didymodactylos carnosus TaxID=1234261 RepID=A0A814JVA5_9BILA|nr:unnamed protein product [Didymodactylos carnosus]CAF1043577.1 unnamed protein product [Didymodactylos carnosus]CAF3687173.1 unnamed protein product [Didymodactylos carnosus]CAF3813626.1 unnamed protein product [Didymodactylos carnosus]